MQNIVIPNEYDFQPELNSYVCIIKQSIPNWNTLFKKGCVSVVAQMSPHSTCIASQYPRTPPEVRCLYVVCTVRYFCPLRSLQLKGCVSATAEMQPHSTGITSQYEFLRMQDKTIYSKLEYSVQKKLCICCSANVATFHRHCQLVHSYPSWGRIVVCYERPKERELIPEYRLNMCV